VKDFFDFAASVIKSSSSHQRIMFVYCAGINRHCTFLETITSSSSSSSDLYSPSSSLMSELMNVNFYGFVRCLRYLYLKFKISSSSDDDDAVVSNIISRIHVVVLSSFSGFSKLFLAFFAPRFDRSPIPILLLCIQACIVWIY
jgi:hypothetical protein